MSTRCVDVVVAQGCVAKANSLHIIDTLKIYATNIRIGNVVESFDFVINALVSSQSFVCSFESDSG